MAPSPYILGNPGNLFGSPMMPRPTATPMMPAPAPAARPPAPTSAANLQALLALSGQDRANAFLKGLGAMGPALIAAGAPSTDPGAAQKNIALAGQLRAKTTQDDLTRQRAANIQTLTTQMALQKAGREQQERAGLDRLAAQYGLPEGTSETVLSEFIKTQGNKRLKANEVITQERAIRGELVKATGGAQDTVDAYKRMEAIFYDSSSPTPELFQIDDGEGNLRPLTIDNLGTSGAADLALIFNFMKAQDPRSVVREGEFAMAANTGGFGEYIKSLINRVENGKMLTNKQRASLMSQGRNQFIQADATIAKQLERFGSLADRYKGAGISRENIVGGFSRYTPLLKMKASGGLSDPAPQTAPRPTSRSNAPIVGSPSSSFKLPNPTN